jgi:hypothetical protein
MNPARPSSFPTLARQAALLIRLSTRLAARQAVQHLAAQVSVASAGGDKKLLDPQFRYLETQLESRYVIKDTMDTPMSFRPSTPGSSLEVRQIPSLRSKYWTRIKRGLLLLELEQGLGHSREGNSSKMAEYQ